MDLLSIGEKLFHPQHEFKIHLEQTITSLVKDRTMKTISYTNSLLLCYTKLW